MIRDQITAGDTLDFLDTVAGYPAGTGWTLKYRLVPRFTTPTQTPVELTGADEGTDYRVQAGPAVTALWVPGVYTFARWLEKTGARLSLGTGEVEILADPATAVAGYDQRTHPRKALEAIEAVLEGRASLDQEEYTINGRSLKRTPVVELYKMRERYRAEVATEDAAAALAVGAGVGRRFRVRF